MHANLFDIRWSQFYAFIASVPDGSAKNSLGLRFGGFPKRSCRISELNSLGYSCLARSACHKGLEKLFTYSGHVHIELKRGNEGCYTSAAQRAFPFCSSTSIKSTMTNEADSLAVYGESQSAEVLVLFLCDGQILGTDFAPLWLAVEEDHVDWISGQTRGLSGQ